MISASKYALLSEEEKETARALFSILGLKEPDVDQEKRAEEKRQKNLSKATSKLHPYNLQATCTCTLCGETTINLYLMSPRELKGAHFLQQTRAWKLSPDLPTIKTKRNLQTCTNCFQNLQTWPKELLTLLLILKHKHSCPPCPGREREEDA
jgi:hypothetical protein